MSGLIVTVEEVRERMSLQNLDEINLIISSGLVAAQAFFEAVLDSNVDKVTAQTDIFYTDTTVLSSFGGLLRLRLKRRFVDDDNVAVYADVTRRLALDETTAVETDFYEIDAEKGLIVIEDSYENLFIRVVYDAGFDANYVAPTWLKEAVLTFMPAVIVGQTPSNAEKNQEKINLEIRKIAASMIDGKNRYTYPHFRPLY